MFKLHSLSIVPFSLFLVACGAADPADTLGDNPTPSVELSSHVETHPSQGQQRIIDGAAASVAIFEREAQATLSTSELTSGHVYTLWFVAINEPSQCATAPCKAPDILGNTAAVQADVRWAAGGVADDSGALTLKGSVPVGPWDSGWYGTGLTNPKGVEIHLVVNDHGPVLEGREQAMQTSYREGCTDDSLPPPFPEAAKSDGVAGPNKCALVQDAIFVQAK
jgi:hypothetical protein